MLVCSGFDSNLLFNDSGIMSVATGNIKRRRTHGYAVFSSEMRKKMADSSPMTETSKIIAEEWRKTPPGYFYSTHFLE